MDVEMTIDAVHLRESYKSALFFTGDADFLALFNYLKKAKKEIYVFSSKNNVSTELRSCCLRYIDVLKIKEGIWGSKLLLQTAITKNHPHIMRMASECIPLKVICKNPPTRQEPRELLEL